MRRCPHELKNPHYTRQFDLTEGVNCVAYGLDPGAYEALESHHLLEAGTIRLEDLTLDEYELAQLAGADIARMIRQGTKAT